MTTFELLKLPAFSKFKRYWSTLRIHWAISGNVANLEIRQVEQKDICRITKTIWPAHGRTLQDELDDQNRGLLSIIVAWAGKLPTGYSFISWEGARDPDIRKRFPNIPELYRLAVLEHARSKGIGTALIHAQEKMARERGHSQIGLGVAHTNTRAHVLYQRLGYREVINEYHDRYHYLDDEGQVKEASDKCRFMIKDLN